MEHFALRWSVVVAAFAVAFALPAQSPDVDAWMARHFSGKTGVKQDAKADEALYAAIGLDSLRKNRFIGEVGGTMHLPNGKGQVQYVLWTDTLEAVLHYFSPGDTTTFVADLRNNTITFHQTSTDSGEVNSSINDLRERVVVNWYRDQQETRPWRVFRWTRYKGSDGILGQDMNRWMVLKGDTIRFQRFSHGPSPFVDALEWLPYGGDYPFNLIMLPARAGDPMPHGINSKIGRIDVEIKRMGPGPRPNYRTSTAVVDTRTKAYHVLPIRKSNRRVGVIEMDPVVALPEGGHYASGDPGHPGEPEVTFVGSRSRGRVHGKDACGDTGTVVIKVWIDRKGFVQRAEIDKKKSTIRSETCLNSALEAAKKDTFYPIEAGMPLDTGELTYTYAEQGSGYHPGPGVREGSGMGNSGNSGTVNGVGDGTGSGPGGRPAPHASFSYDLKGRTLIKQTVGTGNRESTGKVVMDIWVDRKGKVLRAVPGRGSTTTAENLVTGARAAAMGLKFSADPEAPEEQRGTATYVFKVE